jgi:predicted TIM-barrel fold metal-dependent hydrolase
MSHAPKERATKSIDTFDGVKICACRLKNKDLTAHIDIFKKVEAAGKYISIDMADGDEQVESLQKVIDECPDLRIAIGHFGMVTTPGWQKQIELAKNKNVYIESGGLTWLFHKEFYPYPSAIDAILEARDICGMEKLMWGSDYPRTMTDITYKSAVRFILDTPKMTENEKRLFLGENAVKFYGFEGLQPLPEIENML